MSALKTTRWDAADHLEDDGDVAAYLEAAFEDGDHQVIAAALGDIARAKGMSWLARETGLGRESLYKSLSVDGNPNFATVLKVMRALGIRLRASVAGDPSQNASNAVRAASLADEGEPFGK